MPAGGLAGIMQYEGRLCEYRSALAWDKGAPRGRLRGAFRCFPSFRRRFEEDRDRTYYLFFQANPRAGDRHGWEGAEGWGDETVVYGQARVRWVHRIPTPEWLQELHPRDPRRIGYTEEWVAGVELEAGLARRLEEEESWYSIQSERIFSLRATEVAVLEHLCQQGRPSDVARVASYAGHLAMKAVQWILADCSAQVVRWAEEARLGRQCAQIAARIAWAAEVAAGLSWDTAQCAVELELRRREQRQPRARQAAAAAAKVALLAARQGTAACVKARSELRRVEQEAERMETERRCRWQEQFGSLRRYGGVGHRMMEKMGWQVGSRLGKQYSWQRAWRPVQATSYSNRSGIRSEAEPLRYRHSSLVFAGSSVQLAAKAAALVAVQVACRCLSLSSTMSRYQSRVRSGLAAEAALQGAVMAMEVAGGAADCVAVAVSVEAAGAAQAALRRMGMVLAPMFARVHWRHRGLRLTVRYQHQQRLVNKSRLTVRCPTVEGVSEGCVLLSCPAENQCVDGTWSVDLVNHVVRALRPTEACSTSENLSKRPKS